MPNPAFNLDQAAQDSQNALEKPSVMEAFKNRVDKFWATYTQLQAKRNEVPAALRDEYNRVMEQGGRIRATIESITNTYDAAAEWVSDLFGYSESEMGLDGVRWNDALSGNLGVVQFVPLAIITGASAFIVKWLKDAYTMERKLTEQKRLESQGYDPQRAAQIVNKTITGPGLLNIGVNMKPLFLIGGIGLAIWYANRKGYI